jgi:lysozyme
MDMKLLRQELTIQDGKKKIPYRDFLGNWTVGIGHNLSKPLSDTIIELLFTEDLAEAIDSLDESLPWWRTLDEVRQRALVNLCFNMGIGGLLTFKKTLAFFKLGFYEDAAENLLDSEYAKQVGRRARIIAHMIATGMTYDPTVQRV